MQKEHDQEASGADQRPGLEEHAERRRADDTRRNAKVSVVVPGCDRADLLDRCLAALLAHTVRGADMEIIVVDDAALEHSDFHFHLLEKGARIKHVPQALVVHPVRPARWGVSISRQRKIQFDALLYKKHPLLYRRKIRATPRWDYYLTVAAIPVLAAWWRMVGALRFRVLFL